MKRILTDNSGFRPSGYRKCVLNHHLRLYGNKSLGIFGIYAVIIADDNMFEGL